MRIQKTPIIVIEETESFLHPSAQAEFGRVLQDLSEEFGVQILATTHSPYMLNQGNPGSNILLNRCMKKKQPREPDKVCTRANNWLHPFPLASGLESKASAPCRTLFFAETSKIPLEAGAPDHANFEMH